MLPYPTIVVPGITATFLRDFYSLPPEHTWKVMPWTKDYDRIALHPDNLRYEAQEPALMRSDQIYEIAYGSLIEELKEGLIENLDEPVPVFPFGYDWRQPLDDIERHFEAFVQEVIDRTSLLRHYHDDTEGFGKQKKVNLVGHSMGGLIITGYLQRKGKDAPVHKVVTLATPFQGSFEAIVKVVTGTGNISPARSNPRERKAARVTPALYHLLPSFANGVEINKHLPQSLFDPEIWPPNIIDSIAEYMRVYSCFPQKESQDRAKTLLASMLEQAKQHRKRIETFKLSDANLEPKDWLAVVGVGTKTRVHLKIERERDHTKFVIHDEDVKDEWQEGNSSKRDKLRLTGDGTVPYEGAIPPFLTEDNLVLVTPDDYGFWEVQDKFLTEVGGFHGILPCMNMLHRLLIRFFKDNAEDKYNNTWGRRAPGSSTWDPPFPINPKKSFKSKKSFESENSQ